MELEIFTTGGTIDKVYFDASSEYEVGEPTVPHVFREAGVTLPWRMEAVFRKDSLEIDDLLNSPASTPTTTEEEAKTERTEDFSFEPFEQTIGETELSLIHI